MIPIHELKYWNAFNQLVKIGAIRFKKIYSHFENMEQAWYADWQEFKRAGLEDQICDYIQIKRKEISPDREFEKIEKEKIKIITFKDKNYPKLLKEIYNPPALLYVRGEIKDEDEFALAVVGTRKMTSYGKQVIPDIVSTLARNKITIISGLALGCDTLVHETSLRAGGRTIAVIGSGLDKESIYPYSNKPLAEKIEAQGAVISEFPCGSLPLRQNFPARNRIISGLALGTLVVEAPENSGALLTARAALEQNRDVFAIPQNIYNRTAAGPNNLIKMGAKLITSAEDILNELNLKSASSFIESKKITPDTAEEAKILEVLSKEPLHIDKIVQKTKMETRQVTSTLTLMEMKGKVRNLGALNYVIAR